MKLNPIFADRMIFQAGKPVRIFGEADSAVAVSFAGASVTVQPKDGKFLAELPAMPYGGPYELTVTGGGETKTFTDVYVGEVVLCAGQSNIQFTLAEEITPPSEYITDPMFRQFFLTRPEQNEGVCSDDGWLLCEAESVGRWSALAYLIGVRLRKLRGCPVGVVVCTQGASVIQSWMDEGSLDDPDFDIPAEELFGDHTYSAYTWNSPSQLYHFMLETILPYSFGNVVWYQGESNASPAEGKVYRKMLKNLILGWRRVFLDDALPFVVVQIADTRKDWGWIGVQAAQLAIPWEMENVRAVRCGDICETNMIHPVTKGPLADRILPALTLYEEAAE